MCTSRTVDDLEHDSVSSALTALLSSSRAGQIGRLDARGFRVAEVDEVSETWEGTAGEELARRVNDDIPDLSTYRDAPGVGDLEEAIDNLVLALGGKVTREPASDAAADAHLTVARIHLQLGRTAKSFVWNSAAAAVTFFLGDLGITPALNFLRNLIKATTWMSPEERDAVEFVMTNMRGDVPTTRDELVPFNIDVQKLIEKGVLREMGSTITVSM